MSTPELEWQALHEVQGGGVAKSAGVYLDHGRPVPGHLIGVFDRLVWAGLVAIVQGDPLWAQRRLSLTDTGQTRYAALGELRRSRLPVPPPEHGTRPREGA